MEYVDVTIKGIDAGKYRKVKGIASEENVNVAVVVNEALEKVIEGRQNKFKKIDKNDSFFKLVLEPVDCGVDTDVRNADKYIYV